MWSQWSPSFSMHCTPKKAKTNKPKNLKPNITYQIHEKTCVHATKTKSPLS